MQYMLCKADPDTIFATYIKQILMQYMPYKTDSDDPTLVWSRPFGGTPWVHHGVSYGYPMALSGLILGYPMGILGYPRVSYAIWLNQHFGSTIQS